MNFADCILFCCSSRGAQVVGERDNDQHLPLENVAEDVQRQQPFRGQGMLESIDEDGIERVVTMEEWESVSNVARDEISPTASLSNNQDEDNGGQPTAMTSSTQAPPTGDG